MVACRPLERCPLHKLRWGDEQRYRLWRRSPHRWARLLGRPEIIGFIATGRDGWSDQASSADRRARVVARAVGCNMDGSRLIGDGGIRVALNAPTPFDTPPISYRARGRERANWRNASGLIGH